MSESYSQMQWQIANRFVCNHQKLVSHVDQTSEALGLEIFLSIEANIISAVPLSAALTPDIKAFGRTFGRAIKHACTGQGQGVVGGKEGIAESIKEIVKAMDEEVREWGLSWDTLDDEYSMQFDGVPMPGTRSVRANELYRLSAGIGTMNKRASFWEAILEGLE